MMSTIVNIMKLFIAFAVLLKVAQSRFLQPDNVQLQKLSLYNYDQPHPISTPYFRLQQPLGYRPIPAYDQSRYPVYSYGNLDSPFSRKYRPYWIFRTKICWPLNKETTTDRNMETTTEGVIITEKPENTESNTIIAEERTVNLFNTSEAPTTVSQEMKTSQSSTTAADKNATKDQEESTISNVDNIIPIDFDEPEAV